MSAKKKDAKDQPGAEKTADGAANEPMNETDGASAKQAEATGQIDENEASGEGAPGAESPDQPEDPDGAIEDADQLNDRLLRLSADFDNFRKRTQRDKEEWSRYASQSIVEKLLPVVDSFDAAEIVTASVSQEAKHVADGFLMIQKQLADILTREGLSEIPALGEAFDPNVHEAVMMVSPEDGQADNQVVMVMRKGYMFKDKVLRPAMVQVAKDG